MCDACPTGCDNCFRDQGVAICTKCTDNESYPAARSTNCIKCPKGCNGCYLVNNKVSCTTCKSGWTGMVNGLIKTCGGLEWWHWVLIVAGCVLILAGIIGMVMAGSTTKDPNAHKMQNQNNPGYEMNQSMDQSYINNGQNRG